MNNNESLDSMARRYKDEMMRLYRSNGNNGANMQTQRTTAAGGGNFVSRQTESGQCRFMSADEIINTQDPSQIPMPLPIASPYANDASSSMMNGTPNNLAGNGSVNMDSNSRNSSGENIFVPYNLESTANSGLAAQASEGADGELIRGVMINSAQTGNTSNASPDESNVFSELLPSFDFPVDLDEDAATPARISPGFVILGSWTNITGDNGWGLLQFEVTTGSLGNPVQGATVVISRIINRRRLLTRILTTGYSGLTKSIYLPAPRYTCGIGWSCTTRPFAEYTASVYAKNYYPVTNISVMVEAGIKSLQPVDMIPLPSNTGTLPGIQPRSGD